MKSHIKLLLTVGLAILSTASSLSAAPSKAPVPTKAAPAKAAATFRVNGAVAQPGEWSVSKIERDFGKEIKTLNYSIKGKNYVSRCVPLLSLIEAAQPRFVGKTKHPKLRFLVKVQSQDGYSIWLSMGDLSPDFGKREIYVALDADGQPFAGKEAPVRLLVPGDKDYGRWIYGIKAITVVDGSKLQTP